MSPMWTRNRGAAMFDQMFRAIDFDADLEGELREPKVGTGEFRSGSPVRAVTLGSVCGAQRTASELVVSMALAKSYPPAPGEFIHGGLDQNAPTGGSFELPAMLLEVRVTAKIFPGEIGRVERSQILVRARSPPIGLAPSASSPLASCRLLGPWRSYGPRGAAPYARRPATHVAVAARNRISASVGAPPRSRCR